MDWCIEATAAIAGELGVETHRSLALEELISPPRLAKFCLLRNFEKGQKKRNLSKSSLPYLNTQKTDSVNFGGLERDPKLSALNINML